MRYKVKLVPAGVLPKDTHIGIHLADKVVPGDGCCDSCDSWAVTIDDAPSTGNLHFFPNAATTISIVLLGALCPGHCIEWELQLLRGNSPQLDDFVITPNGCTGATIVGGGSLGYEALYFGAYSTIDGHPFCEPVLFTVSDVCVPTQSVNGWYSLLDPVTSTSDQEPVESTTVGAVFNESTFPNRAFKMDFSPDVYADWIPNQCADNLTADFFIINGGDPGAYGDFTIENTLTANAVFRLVASGVNDYTDIQIILQPELRDLFPGLPVSPQITLNCTGSP